MESLRKYPLGKFIPQETYSEEQIKEIMHDLRVFPKDLRAYLENVPEESWDSPYRLNGWTVRQVVHHLADSHAMMYIRVKLALTTDRPTVPGYPESSWAELPDNHLSPWVSVHALSAIHERLVYILEQMPVKQWQEAAYYHAGYGTWNPLDRVLALYQWHGKHHLAHIKLAVETPEL